MPEDRAPQEAPEAVDSAEMAEAVRRLGPRNPVLRFLGQNRGVTALLAVVILGALFTPQRGVNGPYLVNVITGQAAPLRDSDGTWNPPRFLTSKIHSDVLYEYAEYGLLAVGMTLVILTAGIDLSVGSVLGIAAVTFAYLLIARGTPPAVAVAGAAGMGALCGLINGFLVSKLRLQPFVATLAMMVAARGGAKVISGGYKIQAGGADWYWVQGDLPAFMSWMVSPSYGGFLRPVTLLFIVSLLVMVLVVKYTRFGRYLYAVGGNEEAARLSGVPVNGTKILAYSLCGLFAGLAGFCNACRTGLGNPEAGTTFELDAIAAVVIGGTSLAGGRGAMILTLLGALIVGYIDKALSVNNVDVAYRLLAKGLIIVIAVVIQSRRRTN